MVISNQGLFFIKIDRVPNTDIFKLEQTSKDFFEKEAVRGAFEYKEGKFILLINGTNKIRFFDKEKEKEDTFLKLHNLSDETSYRCLQPFPGYDYEKLPFVLIKDSISLSVINTKTMKQ